MAENERDFKGVWIPKIIWLDDRLSALDKVILTEIDSLDQGERGCYASNKHIAEFCQCSEAKVTKSVSRLIKFGYLYMQKFDGRQRELKSRLSNFASLPSKNYEAESENLQESNTSKNTATITDIKYIIEYLNTKAGKTFRHTTKATQSHINARYAEGFKLEDFKRVIDNQCAKWKGTEWEQYLRPSTLFGTKFENYLNAKPQERNETDGTSAGDSTKVRISNVI